jgi:CRISPR-associated protein Csh2
MDSQRQKALRGLDEVSLDIGGLLKAINAKRDQVASVRVITDGEIKIIQEEELKGIGQIEVR